MKLKYRDIDKYGVGYIVLFPEETEDLWHVYNLISVGDQVRTSTVRKITTIGVTGSTNTKERKKITLTIIVDKLDFDSTDCILRLSGRNIEENQWVKMGAAHTVQIELHKQFTIKKEYWDPISIDRVTEACEVSNRAEIAAVMIDEGLANIILVTDSMSIVKAHISTSIPRKRKGAHSGHDKALERFFTTVYETLIRKEHVNFEVVKCLIIAGPGFIKEQFAKYMFNKAVQQEDKVIISNRSKVLSITASSAHKYSLKEVLNDKQVLEKIHDTKAAKEVQSLNRFYHLLQNEPGRATYGLNTVLKANTQNAIEILLIADNLFRSADVPTRKQYVALTESVRENGGEVRIFSSLHVSGEQLAKLSGIAAILRFPIPDLDDEEENEDSEAENPATEPELLPLPTSPQTIPFPDTEQENF